jgi:hypothetical protein
MSTVGNPTIEVSHLPSATSFYAEVARPLGISYLSASSSRVNFGWVSQSPDLTPQLHVVLSLQQALTFPVQRSSITLLANSPGTVERFYKKSLLANSWQTGHTIEHSGDESVARTRDLDGNMLEAVYSARAPGALPRRRTLDIETASTPKEAQRVLQWQQEVARSVDLSDSNHSLSLSRAPPPALDGDIVTTRDREGGRPAVQYRRADSYPPASQIVSERSARLVSRETVHSERYRRPSDGGLSGMKLVGTLLGAAAGAAIAYAAVRSDSPPRYAIGPRRASYGDQHIPRHGHIPRDRRDVPHTGTRAVERPPPRSYIGMDRREPHHVSQYTIAGPPPSRIHDWARIEERSQVSYRTGRSEQKPTTRERSRSESGARYNLPPAVLPHRSRSPHAPSQVSHRSHKSQRGEERGIPHRPRLDSDRHSYISARSHRTEKPDVRYDSTTSTTTIRVVPKGERRGVISAHNIPLPESVVSWSKYAESVAPSDSVSSVGSKRERERLRDRMRERW